MAAAAAANSGRVTVGEVDRKLDAFRTDVNDRFDRLEHQIAGQKVVYQDTYDADQRSLRGTVTEIQTGLRNVRMALFSALLSLVVMATFYLATRGGHK
jgi:hypothetical protein